jgi:hypothetical protein
MMLVYARDEDSAPDSWRPRIVGRGGSNGRYRTLEPASALGGRRYSPRGIRPGTHSNLGEISRLVSPGLSHNSRSAGCARRSAPSPPRLLAKGRVNLRQRYGSQSVAVPELIHEYFHTEEEVNENHSGRAGRTVPCEGGLLLLVRL